MKSFDWGRGLTVLLIALSGATVVIMIELLILHITTKLMGG